MSETLEEKFVNEVVEIAKKKDIEADRKILDAYNRFMVAKMDWIKRMKGDL